MKGYLSYQNDSFEFLFENGVKFTLDFIEKEKINEVYRNGTHRVKMVIPTDSVSFDNNGEIEAFYEGDGIYGKKRLSRLELNLSLDYQSSFDSPISHLYVPYKEGYKSQDHVHIHIDTSTIDFIGDDHLSIYDLNKKEKEITEYRISECE